MYVEEHYWRERSCRAITHTTKGLNSLLKRSWDLVSFRVYRDSRKLVERAVLAYGYRIGDFDTEDDIEKRVGCIVKRIIDAENANCWGVDCAHVAKYLDKDYERYIAESSSSYKILWRLYYAVKEGDSNLIYEALNEAYEHIEAHEKAYSDRQAPARPGDVTRAIGDGLGEERTLP